MLHLESFQKEINVGLDSAKERTMGNSVVNLIYKKLNHNTERRGEHSVTVLVDIVILQTEQTNDNNEC